MNGRRQDPGQNIQRRERRRIAHQGQLKELLNRATPELRPDPLVFASRLGFRRMRRPVDARASQVVQTDSNRSVALIEGRVQIHAQARDSR
jgi:hypothetical protein